MLNVGDSPCLPGLAFRAYICHVLRDSVATKFWLPVRGRADRALLRESRRTRRISQGRLGTIGGIGEDYSRMAKVTIHMMLRKMSNAGPRLPTLRSRLHPR